MNAIYEPNGKAREYSPFALNLYTGCDHGCFYCYVPKIIGAYKEYDHTNVVFRDGVLEQLKKDVAKNVKRQVLLSFTGDPYCKFNDKVGATREALKILREAEFPVAILTKGGNRALSDMDEFLKFKKGMLKIGTTLVFEKDADSLKYEPGAAPTSERIAMLQVLFNAGITTWVSIEPVCEPGQSIALIKKTAPFVNHFKIGKLNHMKFGEGSVNWNHFLYDCVMFLRGINKPFYIKDDLAVFARRGVFKVELTADERNSDKLAVGA